MIIQGMDIINFDDIFSSNLPYMGHVMWDKQLWVFPNKNFWIITILWHILHVK